MCYSSSLYLVLIKTKQKSMSYVQLLSPFYWWANWGKKWSRNLLKPQIMVHMYSIDTINSPLWVSSHWEETWIMLLQLQFRVTNCLNYQTLFLVMMLIKIRSDSSDNVLNRVIFSTADLWNILSCLCSSPYIVYLYSEMKGKMFME